MCLSAIKLTVSVWECLASMVDFQFMTCLTCTVDTTNLTQGAEDLERYRTAGVREMEGAGLVNRIRKCFLGCLGRLSSPCFFYLFCRCSAPNIFSTFNCNHCKRVQGSNIRCNKKIEPTWPDFIPFQMLFLAVPCLQHPLLTVASYHRPPLHTLLLSHVQPFLKATLQFKDIWPKWYVQFLPFCSCFDPF